MAQTASERGARIVGREAELSALDEFLRSGGSSRGLVIAGAPGIGKTTLWETGVELARQRGLRVLTARGSGAETRLSSAALVDLLDSVGREELAALPGPQLHALEVSLFRAEPTGGAPEGHAIGLGLLNALRALPLVNRSSSRSTICSGSTARRSTRSLLQCAGSTPRRLRSCSLADPVLRLLLSARSRGGRSSVSTSAA